MNELFTNMRRKSAVDTRVSKQPDTDISVTVQSGMQGNTVALYHLHKNVLQAHSHYFKRAIQSMPYTGVTDHITLACSDKYEVFPYIIKYMYQGKLDWKEDVKVQVCQLALRLEMHQILHIAKTELKSDTTDTLIRYLNLSYRVVQTYEFVEPVANVLAKRLGRPEDTHAIFGMIPSLFELVLRSPSVDLSRVGNIQDLVEKYLKHREKKHKEKITPNRREAFDNLAEQLAEMHDMVLKLEQSQSVVPIKLVKMIRGQFYDQLSKCTDLCTFNFMFRPDQHTVRLSPVSTPRIEITDPLARAIPAPTSHVRRGSLAAPLVLRKTSPLKFTTSASSSNLETVADDSKKDLTYFSSKANFRTDNEGFDLHNALSIQVASISSDKLTPENRRKQETSSLPSSPKLSPHSTPGKPQIRQRSASEETPAVSIRAANSPVLGISQPQSTHHHDLDTHVQKMANFALGPVPRNPQTSPFARPSSPVSSKRARVINLPMTP